MVCWYDTQDKEKSQELNRMEHFLKLNFSMRPLLYLFNETDCRTIEQLCDLL